MSDYDGPLWPHLNYSSDDDDDSNYDESEDDEANDAEEESQLFENTISVQEGILFNKPLNFTINLN